MEGEHLAAVCGLYCGACSLYRARRDENPERLEELLKPLSERWQVPKDELNCDGCLAGGRLMPHCRDCKIKQCAAEKEAVTRCSGCPDFPCQIITAFNNDGVRHHAEVLDNIRRQQKVGVTEWLQEQFERWRCQFCGVSLDWYARSCYRCGTKNALTINTATGDRLQPYYRG